MGSGARRKCAAASDDSVRVRAQVVESLVFTRAKVVAPLRPCLLRTDGPMPKIFVVSSNVGL